MILKCTVGDILAAVDKVWETTDAKKAAIASNIYIKGEYKANGSWLYIYSTDYQTQCMTRFEVTLDESFEAAIDPESLTKGIRSLNHEIEAVFSTTEKDKNTIHVKASKVRYKVPHLTDASFHAKAMQSLPALSNPAVSVHPSILVAGIKSVAFAVSNDSNLYGVIRSIEIHGKDNILKFSASDGAVAAVSELKCPTISKEFKMCLSKADSAILIKVISMNPAGEAEIYPEGIYFKFPDTLLAFGNIPGKLPDIKAIVDKFPITSSNKIDRKSLLETCNRAALFVKSGLKESSISITCNKTGLKFVSGSYDEELDSSFSVEKTIKMSKDYLISCINSCKGKEVELGFTAQNILRVKDLIKEEEVDLTADYVIMGQQ